MPALARLGRLVQLIQTHGLARGLGILRLRRYDFLHQEASREGEDLFVLPPLVEHGFYVRRRSSDVLVYDQIFLEREYAPLNDLSGVGLVLDCGANVGYSSAYFLSHFPGAHVVAVEPDDANFAMLQRNLAPYGDRVRLVHAGIWSHDTDLVMADTFTGEGDEWARQVRPCKPGETPAVQGISIETLLAESGADRISILKVDIEGAEAVVFSDGYEAWIDRVDAIAIELHDDTSFGDTQTPFFDAIEGQGFDISRSGELTICRRDASTLATVPDSR